MKNNYVFYDILVIKRISINWVETFSKNIKLKAFFANVLLYM
jgi:hypothetical protein